MDRAMNLPNLSDIYLEGLLRTAEFAERPVSTDEGTDAIVASGRSRAEPAKPPGWLETEVLREYQQIRSIALSDTFKPYTNEEFEQAVEDLLTFARQRSASVKDQVHQVHR